MSIEISPSGWGHLAAAPLLHGAIVTYSDPYVPSIRIDDEHLFAAAERSAVAEADCTVIVTDHSGSDYAGIVSSAKLIVDTRNALRRGQLGKGYQAIRL